MKLKIQNILFFLLLPFLGFSQNDFRIVVNTANTGVSASNEFQFTGAVGDYSVAVYDQTGTTQLDSITGLSGVATIDLTAAGGDGVYELRVYAAATNGFNQISFSNGGDKDKLIEVRNWGNIVWSSIANMFYGCSNLTSITSIVTPDLSNVTVAASFARLCTSLTTLDVSNWNTTNITNFVFFVSDCTNLTTLDVSNWNTSNVTTFFSFARNCTNLTALDVSNWNTSNVTNFGSFAISCGSLTTLDVSNWNTSNVTDFASFARLCPNLTDIIGIENFDISSVTVFGLWLQGTTLPTSRYNELLLNYAEQQPNTNLAFNAGGSKVTIGSPAEFARDSILEGVYGWTITDGSPRATADIQGGAGITSIAANPNTITALDEQDTRYEALTAYDHANRVFYVYDSTQSAGQRWIEAFNATAPANPTDEIQDLSLNGDTLSLSGDTSTVDLSGYMDNTDSQDLSLTGNTLFLTGDPTPVNLSAYLDNTNLSQEEVEDMAGGLFSGNTEVLISATYQSVDNTVDLVVEDDLSLYDNTVSGFLTSETDGSVTNEGSLSVAAGTASTAVINSNTSGSTGVTIEAQAGIGVTENTTTNTIFIENTGDLDATNEIDIIGFTGDVGSAQQIGDGEFLDLEGGYGIVTTMSTDKANFKVDTSQVATVFALSDSLSNISAGTGWLKDSLSVADVDIPMNRNQLSFSSDIPFGLSSDTLISLSTPRSDAAIKTHFLVFNFGALSAGFVEQDENLRFFNTSPGEGLAYAGDYFNATATSSLKNRQIPDIQTVKRLISDSVGTSINIYNTSDTVETDRKVIAQDQNTYLDFLGFDYMNVDNDDGNDNIGLRINGAATAGFENRLLVLSDGKGQDSIIFRHEYRGGLGGFGIVSTIDTDFRSPGFTLTSGSNRLNLATNEYTDGTNSKGLEYAADYSSNFTNESLVTKRYVDAQVVSGSAYWKDTLSTTQTVINSSGLDFVFGSSQLDDSGNAAEDERVLFDNSKGYFAAGRFQSTQVDDANRGIGAFNIGLNNQASAPASGAAGGQNNAATGTGSYVHGENALAPASNQYAHGMGGGSAYSGQNQFMRLVGYKEYTGVGTAQIFIDGSSERFVIPNNTLWSGTAYCQVVVTVGGGIVGVGDRVYLKQDFSARNEAGLVNVLTNPDNPGLNDVSMGAVSLLLGADNTNDALNVNIASIPGTASSEVNCSCYFDIIQTKF